MKDEPVARALEDVATDETLAAVWRGVERGREVRRRRRAVLRATAVGLLVVGTAAYVALRPTPLAPLATGRGELAGRLPAGETRLSDASRIVAGPTAALEVVENSGPRLQLALRSGVARFEVTPKTGRQWHVDVGSLSVDVVGTIFTVERTAVTRVSVERGAVVVRGPGVPDGVRRLSAGEQFVLGSPPALDGPTAGREGVAPEAMPGVVPNAPLTARDEGTPPAVSAQPGVPPSAPETARDEGPPPAVSARPGAPSIEPHHVSGAGAPADASSDWEVARQAPPEASSPPPPEEAAAATDLFALADTERRAGHTEEAAAALERLVAMYPDSAEAGPAAFTLARLAEADGRPEDAARWYRRVLQLTGEPLAGAARRALDGGGR
jgi:hypothetical protein